MDIVRLFFLLANNLPLYPNGDRAKHIQCVGRKRAEVVRGFWDFEIYIYY